jgi:glyoxylase-like metal-dependent hydrolase (beta-lactamase superfamily II)
MPARPSPACAITVGDIHIAFLPDGSIHLPPLPMFAAATQGLFDAHPEVLDEDGYLVMSLGAVLVERGGTRMLVDLGWGPTTFDLSAAGGQRRGRIIGGALLASLSERGLEPADIDLVVFSHLHADHIGWLLSDRADGPQLTFARARYLVTPQELAYWSDPSQQHQWGGPSAEQLAVLLRIAEPLVDGAALLDGVTVMLTAGHTPGHASFAVTSGAERAIVLGDTFHCPLELTHPELALRSDVDAAAGRAARRRLRDELADGAIAVGAHFAEHAISVPNNLVRNVTKR